MTKIPRVVRRYDALKYLSLANTSTGERRKSYILWARMFELFGNYNEAHGYHARRPKGSSKYEQADKAAQTWMLAESKRTKIDGPYALARRYLDTHPRHPGQSRDANIRRLGDRIKRLLRKS